MTGFEGLNRSNKSQVFEQAGFGQRFVWEGIGQVGTSMTRKPPAQSRGRAVTLGDSKKQYKGAFGGAQFRGGHERF